MTGHAPRTNPPVDIEVRAGILDAETSDALNDCPEAMVYGSRDYHRFLSDAAGGDVINFVARCGDSPAACLTAFSAHVPGHGRVINSLPWYGSHGGCFGPALTTATREALLGAYREYSAAPDVLTATLIATPAESAYSDAYRRLLAPGAEDSRIGQITALPCPSPTVDRDLEQVLRQKTRNLVRKACRQEFVEDVRDDTDAWRAVHDLHAENMDRMGGRAKPWDHFEYLRRHIPEDRRRLSLAVLDGQPVAGLLLLMHARTVEYFVPVIRHAYRSLQPLSFLIWHAMRWAIAAGYTQWNWGGTWGAQDSLHHFKAGWGADDRVYRYFVCARPDAIVHLRAHRAEIAAALPYYYLYPYAALAAA
jgi:hypothetical protein